MIEGKTLFTEKFIRELGRGYSRRIVDLVITLLEYEVKQENQSIYEVLNRRLPILAERAKTFAALISFFEKKGMSTLKRGLSVKDTVSYSEMESWVKSVRKQVFGTNEPPYPKDAKWRSKLLEMEPETLSKLVDRITSKADEIYKSHLRFDSDCVMEYMLTGIRRPFPAYSIEVVRPWLSPHPFGGYYSIAELAGTPKKPYLRIEVRDGLTYDEMRSLYDTIRHEFGVKGKKALSKGNLSLIQLVKRKGEPPKKKGIVMYWEAIRQEWNRNNSRQYKDWRCVKRAYDRINDRLKS